MRESLFELNGLEQRCLVDDNQMNSRLYWMLQKEQNMVEKPITPQNNYGSIGHYRFTPKPLYVAISMVIYYNKF